MSDSSRMSFFGAVIGVLVAGGLIAPQAMVAMADEPEKLLTSSVEALFGPDVIDPSVFRKYDIVLDETVSTDAQRTRTVTKIAHGRKSSVSIVTTPTGTYSSDALTSPYVLYPGIDVTPRHDHRSLVDVGSDGGDGYYWSITSSGSFTYMTYRPWIGL